MIMCSPRWARYKYSRLHVTRMPSYILVVVLAPLGPYIHEDDDDNNDEDECFVLVSPMVCFACCVVAIQVLLFNDSTIQNRENSK